jgi:hypothetical protein
MPRAAKASIPASLEPMEARLVSELPTDAGWQFEPKWYRLDPGPWTCVLCLFLRRRFSQIACPQHVLRKSRFCNSDVHG